MNRRIRPGFVIAFAALVVAVVCPIVFRPATAPGDPSIEVMNAAGQGRTVTLREIEALPRLCCRGSYENQFGNWRDEGEYCGVLLTDLFDADADYEAVTVTASDGYRVDIERARLENPDYPVVLAFSFDGRKVSDWADGFRIAVLPEDGGVSNAEYAADSAGSFWVKNVASLTVLAR